jgi:hypothetical protein
VLIGFFAVLCWLDVWCNVEVGVLCCECVEGNHLCRCIESVT